MSLPQNRPFALASFGRSWLLAGLVSAAFAAGCSAPKDTTTKKQMPDPTQAITYSLVQPSLTSLAPSQVALGDTVTIFGQSFIDPQHGTLTIHLDGTFTDQMGNGTGWSGDVPVTYVSPGQATFVFGPNVFFSPDGQTLGTFHGNFQMVSTLTVPAVHNDIGDQAISQAIDSQLAVGPSILINQIRSVDGDCELTTTGTTQGANLAIGMETLGMVTDGTNPVQFSVIVNTPNMNLAFAPNQSYSVWPPALMSTAMVPALTNTTYTISLPGTGDNLNEVVLDPLHYQTVVTVSPPLNVNQQPASQLLLAQFAAGALDPSMNSGMLNLIITATGPDGTQLSRTLNFPMYQALELQTWNGLEKVDQIYPPEETDAGCQSGSAIGQRTYQYTDGTSQTLDRSVQLQQSASATASVDVNAWILRASASSQETFGVNVSQSVSSSMNSSYTATENLVGANVGISYRQPVKTERDAPALQHDTCGGTMQVGTMVLTNWRFNFDINQGSSCPPPPSPGMPVACDGNCPQSN